MYVGVDEGRKKQRGEETSPAPSDIPLSEIRVTQTGGFSNSNVVFQLLKRGVSVTQNLPLTKILVGVFVKSPLLVDRSLLFSLVEHLYI